MRQRAAGFLATLRLQTHAWVPTDSRTRGPAWCKHQLGDLAADVSGFDAKCEPSMLLIIIDKWHEWHFPGSAETHPRLRSKKGIQTVPPQISYYDPHFTPNQQVDLLQAAHDQASLPAQHDVSSSLGPRSCAASHARLRSAHLSCRNPVCYPYNSS